MKTLILISIRTLLLLTVLTSYSQDCKNMVENKKDEFTGEIKKTSMSLLEKGKGHESHFKIRQMKDSISIIFIDFYYGGAIINSKMYTSKKGDIMYILFSDDSVLKLTQLKPAYMRDEKAGMGEAMVSFGYSAFSKSNKLLFEPVYSITKENLNSIAEKKVKKIRVTTSGEHIQTHKIVENIEIELTEENATQLQNDIKCLLK